MRFQDFRRLCELIKKQQMHRILIIREAIILFEEDIDFHRKLSIKICYDETILKFNDFDWVKSLHRWQRKEQLSMPWPTGEQLQLQIYFQDEKGNGVLGQGRIRTSVITNCHQKQIKIALIYDGLYVGSLYCQITNSEQQGLSPGRNFLYMHKLDMILLEELNDIFFIKIIKNNEQVYQKDFHLNRKVKTLFPNIKIPVKMSDVFTVQFQNKKMVIKTVKFFVDNIKRGKTSIYEIWLRNKLKNKVGDLKIEYFLQNVYLQNQRLAFARNGIYPLQVNKPLVDPNQDDKKRVSNKSIVIRNIQQADRRILKINQSMKKLLTSMDYNEKGGGNSQLNGRVGNYERHDTIKQNRSKWKKTLRKAVVHHN